MAQASWLYQKFNFSNITFYKTDIFLYVFLIIQIIFWQAAREHRPELAIVPDVPSKLAIKAISLGDDAFYFRTLAFQLQNAGDTFGRFTALKNYNYNKLYHWFERLDSLDAKSNFVPSIAAYYFSQTQNTPDVRYVIDYLDQHASRDINNKWWWMSQAVYLANHKLKDKDLALKLAYKLSKAEGAHVPLWVKQMPAFIHEQRGEEEQAMGIIAHILENTDQISDGELNFMSYFVRERLNQFLEDHPELKKLPKKPIKLK